MSSRRSTLLAQREPTDLKTLSARGLTIPGPISKFLGIFTLIGASLAPQITETAIANGDTRTIYLHHAHTGEDIAATYLVNGQYDSRVLQQLNWFLRDWRRDEPTNMDPRLFDVVWEAYRSAGAGNQVINVVSAYRSPETNAMLRARSRAVAKYSQHMLGKAMDTTMPGMPMSHIREIGMRMQRGGVGYYPTAGTPFVHLDVGNVRSWPRMSYDQLVRLFPDGKTVHLPTNGQPLARYEEAKAEIEARANGAYVVAPRRTFGGFFAMLFGGGEEEPEEVAPPPSTRKQWAALAPRHGRGAVRTAATGEDSEEGAAPAPEPDRRSRRQIARAEANLPRGETVMTAPGAAPTTAGYGYAAAPAEQQQAEQAQQQQPQPQQAEEPAAPVEKTKRVRAPLPPTRPASLIARLDTAPEPVADDGKPAPLDQKVAAVDASQSGASELRSSVDESAESDGGRKFVNAPLPPRRPATLVAMAARQAPLPPGRPNASHAIATLVEPEDAKPQQAKSDDHKQDDAALAYSDGTKHETTVSKAEAPQAPLPPRRTALAPARPDRPNARGVAAATPASSGSVMGSSTGLRAAARSTAQSAPTPPHD